MFSDPYLLAALGLIVFHILAVLFYFPFYMRTGVVLHKLEFQFVEQPALPLAAYQLESWAPQVADESVVFIFGLAGGMQDVKDSEVPLMGMSAIFLLVMAFVYYFATRKNCHVILDAIKERFAPTVQ
jgi:hypothetical protein